MGRPTLILDVGTPLGSLVGQSEGNIRQPLRIADAMSPCILYADELEKALAGEPTAATPTAACWRACSGRF
jgi:SpoVK/Ycf46/Vps4 family AAA+-type ATPase